MSNTDSSKCIKSEDLSKHLNVSKFNKMMTNTVSKVTNFVDSYIKEQNTIKDNQSNNLLSLEESRYRQTAINVKRKMIETHEKNMKELNKEYELLVIQVKNLEHTKELYEMLKKQNSILKKSVETQIHEIEISDRKTHYENEQNISADYWRNIFYRTYYSLIILFILGIFISKRYKEIKLWAFVIIFILYPYLSFIILDLIGNLWYWIRNNSRLIYLHTDM
jgi:hypothetical protein